MVSNLNPRVLVVPLKSIAKNFIVALARQEATAQIAGASNATATVATRAVEDLEPRAVWERMNESPGNLFYTGEFEQ